MAFADAKGSSCLADCFEFEQTAAGVVVVRQPLLAEILARLARKGPDWFYSRPLAAGTRLLAGVTDSI